MSERVSTAFVVSNSSAYGKKVEYLEVYYNRKRRHSSIGYETPHTFENQLQNVA